MKKLLIFILIYVLSIGPVLAQEDKVCFPLSEAKAISVELQRSQVSDTIISKQDCQIKNLNETLDTLNTKITKLEEVNAKYEKVVIEHEKLVINMEKACDEKVAAAKPGLFTMISGALGILLTGIIIGVLL